MIARLTLILMLVAVPGYAADGEARLAALEAQARLHTSQARRDLALSPRKSIVELHRGGAEPGSLESVRALYRLAVLQQTVGPFAEAEASLREALGLRERLGGEDHPSTATLLRSLDTTLRRIRPDDAERASILTRLLEMEPSSSSRRMLGDYYAQALQHEEALEQFQTALEDERGRAYPRARVSAMLLERIGRQYTALGMPEDAEQHLRRALETNVELLGEEHPRLAFLHKHLGHLYFDQGRLIEAEAQLERALELEIAGWGERMHPCGCDVREMLESAWDALGVPFEPRTADDATVQAPDAIAELDARIARLGNAGHFPEAIELAGERTRRLLETHGERSVEVFEARLGSARLLRSYSRYDAAAGVLLEAFARFDEGGQGTPAPSAAALETLGHALQRGRRYAEAEVQLLRELELREVLGHRMRAASILETLGALNRRAGSHAAARIYYERAVGLWTAMASTPPELFRLRASIAATFVGEGRFSEAEQMLDELESAVAETTFDAGRLLQVLEPRRQLYVRTGRSDERTALEVRLAELRAALRD